MAIHPSIHQIAKLNSTPNFPAIWYVHIALFVQYTETHSLALAVCMTAWAVWISRAFLVSKEKLCHTNIISWRYTTFRSAWGKKKASTFDDTRLFYWNQSNSPQRKKRGRGGYPPLSYHPPFCIRHIQFTTICTRPVVKITLYCGMYSRQKAIPPFLETFAHILYLHIAMCTPLNTCMLQGQCHTRTCKTFTFFCILFRTGILFQSMEKTRFLAQVHLS